MVSAEDIAAVQLFAGLDASEREQLCRVAADISLVPGEYAAHEGDERALFAVLEGRIEPVRLVDGIERVLGERHPGDVFGEVPIALGTVFPVGFRAAEPSRVMRIEPHDYHAVAAVAPDVAKEVGRLAAHRMAVRAGCRASRQTRRRRAPSWSGIAGMRPARSCGASSTATRSASSGSRRTPRRRRTVGRPAAGRGGLPAIRVIDGKTVVRPQLRRVAELLGLGTEPAPPSTTP